MGIEHGQVKAGHVLVHLLRQEIHVALVTVGWGVEQLNQRQGLRENNNSIERLSEASVEKFVCMAVTGSEMECLGDTSATPSTATRIGL